MCIRDRSGSSGSGDLMLWELRGEGVKGLSHKVVQGNLTQMSDVWLWLARLARHSYEMRQLTLPATLLMATVVKSLSRHVRKTRICDCRISGTLPHFSHILAKCAYRIFFPHILAFSAELNILCSYYSNFRIYPIFGFRDNQYSLLSEHGRRFVAAIWRSCCFELDLYVYFPGFNML